jgi:hypothetical protein
MNIDYANISLDPLDTINIDFPSPLNISQMPVSTVNTPNVPLGYTKNLFDKNNININNSIAPVSNNPLTIEQEYVLPYLDDPNIDIKKHKKTYNEIEPPHKNNCYNIRDQSLNAFVCLEPEGKAESDKVRGNEFAVPYSWEDVHNREMHVTDAKKVTNINRKIVDIDPFYPTPDDDYIKDKEFKTYPYNKDLVDGYPMYRYPYQTLSPFSPTIIEGFGENGCPMYYAIILAFLILGILLVYNKIKKLK